MIALRSATVPLTAVYLVSPRSIASWAAVFESGSGSVDDRDCAGRGREAALQELARLVERLGLAVVVTLRLVAPFQPQAAELPAVRFSVEMLFRDIEAKFKVRGRWMRRRDDPSTYMEVYEGVTDAKAFRATLQMAERVLKGWQEEATDAGTDRRSWRWMVEAD